jgi:hypothetical protein
VRLSWIISHVRLSLLSVLEISIKHYTLLYKHKCYIEFLDTEKNRIWTHVKNTIFLRVKISFVVKRIGTDVLLFFTEFCLYNKQKNTWVLGNTTFISRDEVLNMISHSFAALTREISCSTLEINLVFPRTHVLFSIYTRNTCIQ